MEKTLLDNQEILKSAPAGMGFEWSQINWVKEHQAQLTWEIAYKKGMMKVVEWINSNCTSDSGDGYLRQEFDSYAWQAFLKENGIKEN